MKRIAVIIGTRPEAIKLIPIYSAFKGDGGYETILISTGQHKEMLRQIFSFFDVKPDIELNVMEPNQTLATLSAKLISELDLVFQNHKLDGVVVQGDTTTCMVSALVAFYHRIKVVHIEAGLRTYNKYSPFPEEVNRKITGSLADVHFAPTRLALESLKKENISENIFVVGNSVIDSLLLASSRVKTQEEFYYAIYSEMLSGFNRMVLITGHRRENFGAGFEEICQAIAYLADQHPEISFIYPVHLNPNVQQVVYPILKDYKNVFLIHPVAYDHMVYLLNRAFLVMTDSGGIQEEAPTLGKPVIILRDTTERPEGVEAGCSVLAGTNRDRIIYWFEFLINNPQEYLRMSKTNNPYGDGKTSERILEITKNLI